MRHYHTVYVSKAYYPREIWPKELFTEAQYRVKILADGRTEAAHKAWKKYGEEWQRLMRKQDFKISLHVSSPRAGSSGAAGRLMPIRIN